MDDNEIKFTKICNYDKSQHNWELPDAKDLFTSDGQDVEELIHLKTELNKLKSSLNGYDIKEWNRHTNYVNPAGKILQTVRRKVEPELPTQAWCKFYEILSHNLIIPPDFSDTLNAVHLCEAPGGFICSLNHFLKSHDHLKSLKYHWIANALNPYHEGNTLDQCILDDRLICGTADSWFFGTDNTGNILRNDFLDNLKLKCRDGLGDNEINLVTADGSFNCQSNPAEQETIVAHLKYTEAFTALQLLSKGGTFVIKMFTLLEYHSLNLIYLFCCLFSSVTVIKPATSKAGNSEAYVVSTDYCGHLAAQPYLDKMVELFPFESAIKNRVSLFSKHQLPKSFIAQHINCAQSFSTHQQIAIKRNLHLFHHRSRHYTIAIKNLQQIFTQQYFDLCEMRRLPHASYIVRMPVTKSHIRQTPKMEGTFNQRVMQKNNHDLPFAVENVWDKSVVSFCLSDDSAVSNVSITRGLVPEQINSSLYCSTDIIVNYSNAFHETVGQKTIPNGPERLEPDSAISKTLCNYLGQLICDCSGPVMVLNVFSDTNHERQNYLKWFETFVQSCSPNCSVNQVHLQTANTKGSHVANIVFCSLVIEHSPQLWPEVTMRSSMIRAFVTSLLVLQNGGSCFFVLPSVLLRITTHVLYLVGCLFDQVHLQAFKVNEDFCPPAVVFLAQGLRSSPQNAAQELMAILQECSEDFSDIVELVPVTELMMSEMGDKSKDPKQIFTTALKEANELCLLDLTYKHEKSFEMKS